MAPSERNHGRAEQNGNVFYFGEQLAWVWVQAALGCAALPCGQPQTLNWDEVVELRCSCLYPHSQQSKWCNVISRLVQETPSAVKRNYSCCLAKYSDIKQCQNWGCSGNLISTPSFINIRGDHVIEAANSYFMLDLGFRQGLLQDNLSCSAKSEDRLSELFKYFTCFAGSVRSKQEVCGHPEKNLWGELWFCEVLAWRPSLFLGTALDPLLSYPRVASVSTFLLAVALTLGSIFLSRQVSMDFRGPGSSFIFISCKASLPKLQLKSTVDVTACSVSNHSAWLFYFHNWFATSVVISP